MTRRLIMRVFEEHLYLEGRVNHVKLGIKVFNELKTFNEGGQHFVVLIADLNIE